MNNSDIAKKYGIQENTYFLEESLKFYTNTDRELIELEHTGINNLVRSGYEEDDNINYYIKTNNTVNYEFNGKEYELWEYKDCFTYYVCLCNAKLKKFRYIILSDYKEFDGDGVYIYKNKYYCQYYESLKSLFFFNKNQTIAFPGPFIMPDLKKANAEEFIYKYYDIENKQVTNKTTNYGFTIFDDDEILVSFNLVYTDIMKAECRKANSLFKTYIDDIDNKIDNMENVRDTDKFQNKQRFLFENEDFRNFCNEICPPEIFNKELLKNGEVRKNLKSNFWIYHEFQSSLRDSDNEYIEGEDYTFLILNAIKALEYLLYRKISNYQNVKEFDYDDEITDRAMLDKMISYIKEHKDIFKTPDENIISKSNFNSFVDSYINLLFYVKNECRNGYFHKHRIDSYKSLSKKRDKVIEALAKTIILLK